MTFPTHPIELETRASDHPDFERDIARHWDNLGLPGFARIGLSREALDAKYGWDAVAEALEPYMAAEAAAEDFALAHDTNPLN